MKSISPARPIRDSADVTWLPGRSTAPVDDRGSAYPAFHSAPARHGARGRSQDMPLTVARSGHCGGEGVKRRIKHRVHKAIVQRTLTVHRQVRIGILEHLRRRILFRDQEQLPALGAQAHCRPAGNRRYEREGSARRRSALARTGSADPAMPSRPPTPAPAAAASRGA